LVDGGGDQAGHVLALAKDVWERVGERGNGLNGREGELADGIGLIKAEDTLDLVVVDVFLDTDDVGVEVLDVGDIGEDKSLCWVEAERDDVLDVVETHLNGALRTVQLKFRPVDVLLIVSDLDNKRHVKSVLQVLREDERNSVTHVEGVS